MLTFLLFSGTVHGCLNNSLTFLGYDDKYLKVRKHLDLSQNSYFKKCTKCCIIGSLY